jgi:hypothetical protein
VFGWLRLTSAVWRECARKLLGDRAFSLVTGLSPMVCKSIAKASKVRILHLPPRAQRASDLRKRRTGTLLCTRWGYPHWGGWVDHVGLGRRAVTCTNANGGRPASSAARNTVGSSGANVPAGLAGR